MTLTIICGGFWGDEGKGKILSHLALVDKPSIVVRAGVGPNAGHTIFFEGKEYKLRLIPSGFINPDTRLLIGAGVLINTKVLFKEIEDTKSQGKLGIDYQVGIIEDKHIKFRTFFDAL